VPQGHRAWQPPFDRWPRNQVWVELVLTRALLLDGVLAVAEPRTLRYRLVTSPTASCGTPAG
jgi:hypothetical protein